LPLKSTPGGEVCAAALPEARFDFLNKAMPKKEKKK
jgi:hypothetical protein